MNDVLPTKERSPYIGPLLLAAGGLIVGAVIIAISAANPSKWSILGLPLRVGIVVLAVAALATAILWGGHWWRRVLFLLLAVLLGVVFAAAQVNAHFEYIRTVGQLFGEKAKNEIGIAGLVRDGKLPAEGKVVEVPIPGTKSGFKPRSAQVYLPPAWFKDIDRQFPVILLLHGSPGFPEDWVRGGLADVTADKWALQHKGEAPIIAMPDINGSLTGDTECVDSPRGNVETYLNQDVRPFIVDRFGAANQPEKWAIAGLSEGGNCALMLALRRPDLYKTIGDYAGLSGPRPGESDADVAASVRELFGGNQQAFQEHEPAVLLQKNKYPGLGVWFEVASDDKEPLAAAQKLLPMARAAGMEGCLVVESGGSHTFGVFSRSFKDSLPWFSARLGLVSREPSQTQLCNRAS